MGFFTSDFPTKILYSFFVFTMHVTSPAHLILPYLNTLVIYGEGEITNQKVLVMGSRTIKLTGELISY